MEQQYEQNNREKKRIYCNTKVLRNKTVFCKSFNMEKIMKQIVHILQRMTPKLGECFKKKRVVSKSEKTVNTSLK